MLSRDTLHGWSKDKAELMGLPHIGARYIGRRHELVQSYCTVCGRPATNAHHVVPIRCGHTFKLKDYELKSPLIALCGSGTTGCHGRFHSGALVARWHWLDDRYEDAWWSGELLDKYGPHSIDLHRFGIWEIHDRDTGASTLHMTKE